MVRLGGVRSTALVAFVLATVGLSIPAAGAADIGRLAPAPRIATGQFHTCALTSDGRAFCWGGAVIGNGTPYTTLTATPTAVTMPPGKRFTQIAVGSGHSCALASDGTAWCWGDNNYGQLGAPGSGGSSTTPVAVSGGHTFVQLVAGFYYACGLESDGDAWCWGDNGQGQLGDGTTSNRDLPVLVTGGKAFIQLAAGPTASTTCGLTAGGAAWCWGDGVAGQLGNYNQSDSSVPVAVVWGAALIQADGFVQIATGSLHTCALGGDGDVWCWGDGNDGQFGDGSNSYDVIVPRLVFDASASDASKTYVQLVVAGRDTCGVTRDGAVRCWGDNSNGQLGDGTTTSSNVPVAVSGLSGVGQIALGGYHACALTAAGALRCWGLNAYSALGDGTTADRTTPVSVSLSLPSAFTHVASGPYAFATCALDEAGAAWCWGWNANGEIGDGTTTTRYVPTAVTMPSGRRFVQLAGGWHHTCALAADGTIWCWGDDAYGQLGDGGSATDSLIPVEVTLPALPSGARFVQISAGSEHTCGVTTVGAAWCWGRNVWGQLGDGTTTDRAVPTAVSGGKVFTQVAAGRLHTCGLAITGAAWCWGAGGSGSLGTGDNTQRNVPTAVTGGKVFTWLVAGTDHNCGLVSDGSAWCWGYNLAGQLGDGTTTDRAVPTAVSGGKVFTVLSAGEDHSCGRTSSGAIWCWGKNSEGQVGDGTTTARLAPTAVSMPTGVTFARFAAGRDHTCALGGDGSLWCWGWGTSGQVGLGTPAPATTLVPTSLTSIRVTIAGNGSGTVTSSPAGISCPPTCTASFARSTSVTLSTAPDAGSSFPGWSDEGCTDTGTCTVVMTQVRALTVTFAVKPGISSFTPTSGSKGAAITVTGTNFLPSPSCTVKGVASTTCAYISPTTIVTSVPAAATGGTGKIEVTTVGGTATSSGNFTVGTSSTAPTVGSFTPTAGVAGTLVTITGSNVAAATTVKVNTASVTAPWTVLAANQIRITVPVGATTGKITVITAGGTVASSATFTIYQPPTVTALSTTSSIDGLNVTLTGTNFTAVSGVSFNGAPATFSVGSATSLTAKVPRGATAGGISVTNPAGTGTSSTFTPIRYTATQMTAGGSHSCALLAAGYVRCWGVNTNGQLGDGSTTSRAYSATTVANFTAKTLSAGAAFTCAIVSGSSGNVYCWGLNSSRQLGDGTTTQRTTPVQVRFSSADTYLATAVQIATGATHACALLEDGSVRCWGSNTLGQLGNGNALAQTYSVPVRSLLNLGSLAGVTQIAAGGSETCALLNTGEVACWGSNSAGQIGNNSTLTTQTYPALVSGLTGATAIAVGGSHACAIVTNGEVKCWGLNSSGQLGTGVTTNLKLPSTSVKNYGGSTLVSTFAITAGDAFTCALVLALQARCWGLNTSGQLGTGNTTSPSSVALSVLGVAPAGLLQDVTAIEAGGTHVLGMQADGGIAWGANGSGRLGINTTTNSSRPIYILGY